MKNVKLLRGDAAIIDDCDLGLVSGRKWYASSYGYVVSYRSVNGRCCTTYLHRLIAGAKKGELVHHVNHNPFDNRRSNLRLCTNTQNVRHRTVKKPKKSGIRFKGVRTFKQAPNRFGAHITVNREWIYLGIFPTQRDAALAYDRAATKYFGDYALTNASMGLL